MKAARNFQIEKKWIFLDEDIKLFKSTKIRPELIKILASRGIKTEAEALDFLSPEYDKLTDPFDLTDMKSGVSSILKALKTKTKIAIYGDYDIDGVTATAILYQYLVTIGADVIYYIPARDDEGYGLHEKAIKELKDRGVGLIITVDCGSTAIIQVKYAKKQGLDIVITDHHSLTYEKSKMVLPDAPCINPKRSDPSSPYFELAGVGVAFYLIRALQGSFLNRLPFGQEKWLLDLVALGTVGDIVPITGENRILVANGLKVLAKSRNIGIKALAKVSSISLSDIDTYKIGFILGPRLNASGRMEHADKSLLLLITEDLNLAMEIAQELDKLNRQRQKLTERIVDEARAFIAVNDYEKKRKIFLLSDKGWPSGVVGIVASRLTEEYSRPVLIMEDLGDELKGSARSIDQFNIIEALNQCRECFLRLGGHAGAAGFSLKKEKFLILDQKLLEIADHKVEEIDLCPEVKIEQGIELKNIDKALLTELNMLEPYGIGNHKPIFGATNLFVEDVRLVGNPAEHLKLRINQNNFEIDSIAFRYGKVCDIKKGDKIDIVFTIEINEWKNISKIDLHIIDIKKGT